jgi:glycosyltransferase involved in cell wall biosynthesis
MITHSFYESDNRVMRYAETLARRGDLVEVVALRRNSETPQEEVISGVRVFRIQNRFTKSIHFKSAYLWPLLRFLTTSSWWVTRQHRRQRYDIVHVHNIPDFLIFAAWYPKLTGAKLILDIHDIVPELFSSKFGASRRSVLIWGLKWVERLSALFADHVILANHLWLETYTSRSARKHKCSVLINHVDTRIFQPKQKTKSGEKRLIIFPGGLQWHQGLDIAIHAFVKLRDRLPNVEFHIYGEGNMKADLINLVNELGLNGAVKFFAPLRISEIAGVMANADLGVVPKRADSFGNEAYSTKIMEFMSLGVPVVVSDTRIDRYYFNDSMVRFFESGNSDALADAMLEVLQDDKLRARLTRNAAEYVGRNNWEANKGDYIRLVDSLFANGSKAIPATT